MANLQASETDTGCKRVLVLYELLMPRYTGFLTNCLARGAGKLAVFYDGANVKFPAKSRGSGGRSFMTDANSRRAIKLAYRCTFVHVLKLK